MNTNLIDLIQIWYNSRLQQILLNLTPQNENIFTIIYDRAKKLHNRVILTPLEKENAK